MGLPKPLEDALRRPIGARFRRCALQVNPFPYQRRPGQQSAYADADAYNAAVVRACRDAGVELIGITDHDAADDAGLRAAAQAQGIVAFPGMELCSSEGVHILVLFDTDTDQRTLDDFLGWCEIDRSQGVAGECRPCGRSLRDILVEARRRKAVTVAPHATYGKGLLDVMSGQALANIWKLPELCAVAIPDSVDELGRGHRDIIQGKDPNFPRATPIAVVNANDVSSPEGVSSDRAWTWIKVAGNSLEGLRQAFLDPESRVRLSSDPRPEEHSELVAVAWEGGFLDGCRLRLNENLNVLIGGRGAGKSTVVESLRFAIDAEPVGANAREAHQGFVERVLGEGATVSVLVRSVKPAHRRYIIERTVPHAPVVLDEAGERLPLEPRDILPRTEIYGQHEIAEVARRRERRIPLIERFVPEDPAEEGDRRRLRRELDQSAEQIAALLTELDGLDEDLARLPTLEEQLQQYERAGVEERLQQQARFTREQALLRRVDELITDVDEQVDALSDLVPFDRAFLSDKALEELPSADLLRRADELLVELEGGVEEAVKALRAVVVATREGQATIDGVWQERRGQAQAAYEAALRKLGPDAPQAKTFVGLRRAIEGLRPLTARRERLASALTAAQEERADLLQELAEARDRHDAAYRKAAKRASRQLRDYVRVTFLPRSNRKPVENLLRAEIGGRLDSAVQAIADREEFAPAALVDACRKGAEAVLEYLPGITDAQAARLAEALSEEALMRLEATELEDALEVDLNVGGEGARAVWRKLDDLSTGQKATAILLLLLLESDEPLIIDQPEDDLDNAFISEGVVPRIREAKRKRQFLFTTHNANLPVLGDAELIAVVRARGEATEQGRGSIDPDETGSIDSPVVRKLVEQLLEGGREAFETRRRKYHY